MGGHNLAAIVCSLFCSQKQQMHALLQQRDWLATAVATAAGTQILQAGAIKGRGPGKAPHLRVMAC